MKYLKMIVRNIKNLIEEVNVQSAPKELSFDRNNCLTMADLATSGDDYYQQQQFVEVGEYIVKYAAKRGVDVRIPRYLPTKEKVPMFNLEFANEENEADLGKFNIETFQMAYLKKRNKYYIKSNVPKLNGTFLYKEMKLVIIQAFYTK